MTYQIPSREEANRGKRMKIDVYTDDMLIDGKHYEGKLSIADVIEIVKNNVGNLWGWDAGNGMRFGDGAVFLIYIDGKKVFIEGGDRFIQMMTQDDKSKVLWTKVYNNHIHNLTFIDEATPEEIYEIEQIDPRALRLKPKED